MRFILSRLLMPALLLSLAGCGTTRSCGGNDEYLTAVDRPRLTIPAELAASERVAPLVIPPVSPTPVRLDPAPRCLDEPPQYFARTGRVADPVEIGVRAWAMAWANRKSEAVAAFYSPSFQAAGEGGAAAFIESRKQQVATGRSPSADLEDVTVSAVGADRRIVTFVQSFGNDRVRKELTLVREGQDWLIVAERTIEVL
jgi:hypothetical protein